MPQISDILRAQLSSQALTKEGQADIAYLFKTRSETILRAAAPSHTPAPDSGPALPTAGARGALTPTMGDSASRARRVPDSDILGNRTGKPQSGKTVRIRRMKGTAVTTDFVGTTSRWPRWMVEQYLWEVAKIKTRNPNLPKPNFSKRAIALGRLELATQEQLRNDGIFVYRRIT